LGKKWRQIIQSISKTSLFQKMSYSAAKSGKTSAKDTNQSKNPK
jgi:hypothetical protein